jgi:hypothetical protein
MIDNGTICEMGTFAELKKKNGVFSDFVGKNLTEDLKKKEDVNSEGISLFERNFVLLLSLYKFIIIIKKKKRRRIQKRSILIFTDSIVKII